MNPNTNDEWVFHQPEERFSLSMTAPPENSIILSATGEEMLRCSPDGFYVRGKKVKQDDKEAEQVYNCFKEWLSWSTINRI